MLELFGVIASIYMIYHALAWIFSSKSSPKKERLGWYLILVRMPPRDYRIFKQHTKHSLLAGHAISQEIKQTRDSIDRYATAGKKGNKPQQPPRHTQNMNFDD